MGFISTGPNDAARVAAMGSDNPITTLTFDPTTLWWVYGLAVVGAATILWFAVAVVRALLRRYPGAWQTKVGVFTSRMGFIVLAFLICWAMGRYLPTLGL